VDAIHPLNKISTKEAVTMKSSKYSGGKTKKVDGVDLNASCFAYVGDIQNTSTWKLPLRILGDEKKTRNHIADALYRFDQTKGIPSEVRRDVWFTIRGAAIAHGLRVAEKSFATTPEEKVQAETKAQETTTPEQTAIAAAIAEADALAEKMLRRLGLN
jgi:hypothetical protein